MLPDGNSSITLIPPTNNIPPDYLGPRQQKSFCSVVSSPTEVSHLLMSLRNKSSLYEVPTSIFRNMKNTISQAIFDLFNDSCIERWMLSKEIHLNQLESYPQSW